VNYRQDRQALGYSTAVDEADVRKMSMFLKNIGSGVKPGVCLAVSVWLIYSLAVQNGNGVELSDKTEQIADKITDRTVGNKNLFWISNISFILSFIVMFMGLNYLGLNYLPKSTVKTESTASTASTALVEYFTNPWK
jgi:hypothetical protein